MEKMNVCINNHSISSYKNSHIENNTDNEAVYELKSILDRYNRMKNPLPLSDKMGTRFCMKLNSSYLYLNHWKIKNTYYSQWSLKEQGLPERAIGSIIPSKNPINVDNEKRDKRLKDIIFKSSYIEEIDLEMLINGIIELANYLEKHDRLFPEEELEEENEDAVNEINRFEDYDDHIKTEVNEIFKEDPFEFFLEALSKVHLGDEISKEFLLLLIFTKHVKNGKPVHAIIVGSPDSGKTSLANKTASIIPDRFLIETSTMSSKAAFYHMDKFRNDYNHFIINDFLDSPEAIGTLKAMTDTEINKPKHMTVSEGKEGVQLEIKGKNTVVITAATQLTDRELNRRLLHLNPDESEEQNAKTKEFIAGKEAGIGFSTYDPILDVCKCLYDRLIENEYYVINPWLTSIDNKSFTKTDLKHFSNLVKARALIYQSKRMKIDDDTILASLEDIEEVLKLWDSIKQMQRTYLPDQAFKMIDLLPVWDPNKFNTEKHYGKSVTELSQDICASKKTIMRWVLGEEDQQGLSDVGLVYAVKDGEGKTAPWVLYKTKTSDEEKEAFLVGHSDMTKHIIKESNQRKIIKSVCDYFVDKGFYNDIDKEKLFQSLFPKARGSIQKDEDIQALYQLAKKEYDNL